MQDEIVRRELIEEMAGVTPETMLALLAHVRDAQGGTEEYLTAGGTTAEELDLLRSRLRAVP